MQYTQYTSYTPSEKESICAGGQFLVFGSGWYLDLGRGKSQVVATPKPEARNLKPQTLHPTPETLNPKPSPPPPSMLNPHN